MKTITSALRRLRCAWLRMRRDQDRQARGCVSRREIRAAPRRADEHRRRLEAMPQSTIEVPERGRRSLWREFEG